MGNETEFDAMYEAAFADLMENEGGYADLKGDPGGRTWMGIAERFHPEVFKRMDACSTNEKRIVIAKQFYYDEYWKKMHCPSFPPRVAFELFDTAVLCGTCNATKFLQRAINLGIRGGYSKERVLEEDGVFGPKTLKASVDVAKRYARNVLGAMNLFQGVYLLGLNQTDAIKFGWMRRLSERK